MILVSCALIIKDGKVLVAQNGPDSDHALQWEFPGGKIKPEETASDSIIREIEEELELRIKVLAPLQPVEHDYGIKSIRLVPFICSVESGTIQLNDHRAIAWHTPEDLINIDFSEADKRLIDQPGNLQKLQEYTRKKMHQS